MEIVIIIPIYKKELSHHETVSLRQVYSVLSTHKIVVVKPLSLNLDFMLEEYPALDFISFDDSYFQGIQGYNNLMLSSVFYKKFLPYNYMLIYQLDAYVFRDELLEWCKKGFDYIGAPWLKKPIYKIPGIKQFMSFVHWHKQLRGKPSKQIFYDKIGNGGLSLRKVESHYVATIKYKQRIEFFLSRKRSHFYNEDVFWGTEVSEFKYPTPLEALKFSFDKYPSYCYKLNNKQLPFGCHAWYKRKMRAFWKPVIGF